jgi:demethylmenaquinone methyltransferase/2-methoxy-6-polyprenyl-1,4-benzoquinol methylase
MQVIDPRMRAYYERRAREYDDWWLGSDSFRGVARPGWSQEVRKLLRVVEALSPARVLDLACGTGFLTRHLRGQVVGLDQAPAMVEVAAARLPEARIVQGDAVPLPFADGEFDRVFTGHFYGHLLAGERERFVAEARRVAPELVVVDSALREDVDAEEWQERILNDGSRHRVYKRYFSGPELACELGGGEVLHEGSWFVVVERRPGIRSV